MLWLFRADFWFNCSETLVKQLIDFSRHIEVARVHLRQVILVTCIISGSGKFLDDSLSTVLVTHEKTRLHRMRVAVAVGVTIPNLGRIFFPNKPCADRERKCADTNNTVLVPRAGNSNAKI